MRLREEMTHISGSRRTSGKYKINYRLPMSYASKIDNKTDGWVGGLFIMRVGGTWFVFRPYHWWNDMWRQEFRQDVGLRGRLVVPGSRDRSSPSPNPNRRRGRSGQQSTDAAVGASGTHWQRRGLSRWSAEDRGSDRAGQSADTERDPTRVRRGGGAGERQDHRNRTACTGIVTAGVGLFNLTGSYRGSERGRDSISVSRPLE